MENIIKHKNENDELIFEINKKTKQGKYYIVISDGQRKYVEGPIKLEGFDRLPSGFYKEGFGLTTAGNFILQEIFEKYDKKLYVTIVSSGASKIDSRGQNVRVRILHKELSKLGQSVRNIKREKNAEIRLSVQHYLGGTFSQFEEYKSVEMGYIPGRLSELLETKGFLANLSPEDREAFEDLIPEYLSNITGTLRAKKKLKIIYDTLDAGKKIYLDKVVKEFRNKLDKKIQSEQTWQVFLSEYILLLRHNYGEILEKESVSLQGKFPDFMLVDPYGYLDIYEIKKPLTNLLKHDAGRNNYYWDAEISKAIAQVENYLYQAQRHSDTLANDIRKAKGIDVNIVRPRAYIIAGVRAQLTSQKMKDDFKILSESLKNIDILLYDDLLESLEAFVERTKE